MMDAQLIKREVGNKHGRIHDEPSRARLGGGSDKKGLTKHLGRSSNAQTVYKRQVRKVLRNFIPFKPRRKKKIKRNL